MKIEKLREDFAVSLEQLAFTLKALNVNSPTTIDIKVAEFLASVVGDTAQKELLLAMVEEFKQYQREQEEKPRHLSRVK